MRVGFNPNKDKVLQKSDYFHQVIVPVYIPHQEDYFKDSLKILKICLESLFKTSHSSTYFSIVNNGSCVEVSAYLRKLKQQNIIQELIETSAIGKLNAIFKGLSGHNFSLVTITDSDVLFLNGWQTGTYQVFEHFPKTGAVSPVPSSKMYRYHTENIIGANFFSKKLRFTKVIDPDGMKAFATSVGNFNFYNEAHLSQYLTIESSIVKAVVGAGHFVCTYRNEVFFDRDINFSKYSLGGDSEGEFLDKSVVNKNLWRLSTEDNFAFHMGNVFEDWMNVELFSFDQSATDEITANLIPIKTSSLSLWSKTVSMIMSNKQFRRYFLAYKGLSKEQAANY